MSASAIVFLIPFGGFIAGFLIGYFLLGIWVAKTPAALITGLALLAASYYLVYLLGNRTEFEFEIKGLASDGEPLTPYESPSLK